jgi:hypothetical protein
MSDTILRQERIGPEATLRGYLHKGWLQDIMRYTRQNPDRKCKAMFIGLWDFLFYPVWEQRNGILHITDNIVTVTEHKNLNNELLDWKRHTRDRLHHTQYHLTAFTSEDLDRWSLPHKHNTIKLLRTSHKNYLRHTRTSTDRTQTTLTSFYPKH